MRTQNSPIGIRRFPEHWDVLPFNKAFFDKTGGNPKIKRNQYKEAGELPVIDQGQEYIGGYIDDLDLKCKAPLPCILFGDHTKVFKYVDFPFALGADGVKVLVPNGRLHRRFSYYYINQLRLPDDAGYSRHFKFLKESHVPIPPIEEQKRIAAILDKADAIRRKRRQAIQLADEFLRSVFLDMFGDPMENPKGWPIIKLSAAFSHSPRIGTIKPAKEGGKHIVVRVGELGDYEVAIKRCKSITLNGLELKRFKVEKGDLLLARAIGSEDHLGKASMFRGSEKHVVFDSHVMRLRFKLNVLKAEFFLFWLKTKGGRARFLRKAGKTAVQFNVNAKQISDIDIPLPPIPLQENFNKLICQARGSIEKLEQSLGIKDKLFASLTQKAFRGEL